MFPASAPPLEPEVTLPADKGLPGLLNLFDNEWVWQAFCNQFGEPNERPKSIRPRQFQYQPGMRARVTYVAEQDDSWVVEEEFTVELRTGKAERLFQYPEDPYLPGLRLAASPEDAHELVTKCIQD